MQMKRLCIAAVLGFGMASSFAAFAQQPDQRVSVVSFADSPLTVKPGSAMSATAERAASVSWEVSNVGPRAVSEYMARVYVYRATGEAVGFRGTRLSIPVAPGKSGTALVKFPGAMEVRPSDLIRDRRHEDDLRGRLRVAQPGSVGRAQPGKG